MKGAVDLQLVGPAQQQLQQMGRLTRSLLSTSIRDHVVSMTGLSELTAEEMASYVDKDQLPLRLKPLAEASGWYRLPVGDYEVIVKPVLEDGRTDAAIVVGIRESQPEEASKRSEHAGGASPTARDPAGRDAP